LNKSEFILRKLDDQDNKVVIDIFNYYIENSFAAYRQNKVDYSYFGNFREIIKDYPAYVAELNGEVIGFGFIHPYHRADTFKNSAEMTYFINPSYTGMGLGKEFLLHLERDAKQIGITTFLASISSLNEGSIEFHQQNGFAECGRFISVGNKRGREFDEVWMQKFI